MGRARGEFIAKHREQPVKVVARPVARQFSGTVTRSVWDWAGELPQEQTEGERSTIPGVGQWDGDAWSYPLADGLGSVRQQTDGGGYVTQRVGYAPFGRMVAVEGVPLTGRGYTGERWDGDVGLLYLRARWYDPATRRLLTRDPFPGLAALPQKQHAYVYVANNPINLTDPSGDSLLLVLLAATAGGVLGGVGYYAIDTYLLNADSNNPCVEHPRWDWGEAASWGGAGTVIGGAIGAAGYGGWWV